MKKIAAVLAALMLFAGCANADENDQTAENSPVHNVNIDQDGFLKSEEEFEPLYDITPMYEAFVSGDRSALTPYETAALETAEKILDEIISEDMDDYTKELAVHDWLVANCTYDPGALRAIPAPTEHSDEPYGALILGKAICSGYSTAFMLMMKMLDIPCEIIHSLDDENEEHAWNAVQLDGSWYYVDVTWDDPVPDFDGRPIKHQYFNILYNELKKDHVMTKDSPSTSMYFNCYFFREKVDVASIDEVSAAMRQALERGHRSAVIHITDEAAFSGKVSIENETVRWDKDTADKLVKELSDYGDVRMLSRYYEYGCEQCIEIEMRYW